VLPHAPHVLLARQVEEHRLCLDLATDDDSLIEQVAELHEVGRAVLGIHDEHRKAAPVAGRDEARSEEGVGHPEQELWIGDQRLVHELIGAVAAGEDVLVEGAEHVFFAAEHDPVR